MKIKRSFVGAVTILALLSSTGCYAPAQVLASIQLDRSEIGIWDSVGLRVNINNPYNHPLQFTYTSDRGYVEPINNYGPTAIYHAPFTGGADTIRVWVYDTHDRRNVLQESYAVMVNGEAMAYAEVPDGGAFTDETNPQNLPLKLASIRGSSQTQDIAQGRNPVISPDGRFISYVYYPGNGTSQIYTIDPGRNVTNLTDSHRSFNVDPSWSPVTSDGQLYLGFSSNRLTTGNGQSTADQGNFFRIWRINAITKDLKQMTKTASNDYQPTWSPDGRWIAYSSDFDRNRPGNFRNIWRVDANTGEQTQLTHETVSNMGAYEPSWSPDGNKIAYSRKYIRRQLQASVPTRKIWLLDLNMGDMPYGRLATSDYDPSREETSPSWSPDSQEIAYVETTGNSASVYTVRTSNIAPRGGYASIDRGSLGITGAIQAKWGRQRYTSSRLIDSEEQNYY